MAFSGAYAEATITNPGSALTNFTLMVDLADLPAAWWTAVDTADGTKGRASMGDGTTELACDWIDFDGGADTGLLRILWSGSLANSGTQKVRIYPPLSANASYAHDDTYGSDNAYDAYWVSYWPDGGSVDRTGAGHTGSAQGGVTLGGAAGKLGKGTDYDGDNDYSSVADAADLSLNTTTGNTWMMWYNAPASVSVERALLAKYWDNNPFDGEWFMSHSADAGSGGETSCFFVQVLDASAVARYRVWTHDTIPSGWNHIAPAWDGVEGATGHMPVYMNGSAASIIEAEADFDAVVNRATIVSIGAGLVGSEYSGYTDGILCEVQIHSIQRAAAWVAEEYAQTNDNSTFWGSWEYVAAGGTTIVPQVMAYYRRMRN